MNRNSTILSLLPRLAVGAGATLAFAASPALAQKREPAATLLPARPAPAPIVVRGSTPDAALPSFTGNFVATVPAPNYGAKGSWAGEKWSGLKDTVLGKPNPQDPKPAEPDARLVAPPTNPVFGGGPQAQPQPAPPSAYASPPAYRWYGWGGTTPGSNPHSPTGVYPQGSANWYARSGATPGAFPITPVTLTPEALTTEAPVYSGKTSTEPPFSVSVPSQSPEPKPRYISGPPMPEPRIVARTPIGFSPPPPPEMPTSPSLPGGMPVAIGAAPEGRYSPGELPTPPIAELNWQTASGRGIAPKDPTPPPPPPVALPATSDPAWSPIPAVAKPTKPAEPSISVIRGQFESREPQSVEAIIRNACVGRVVRADVRTEAPGKLVVTFVAASENAARDAAAIVAKLPELKAYEVTFEARVAPR